MVNIAVNPLLPADVSDMLRLWQSTPEMVLRDADSPGALLRYLERNPGLSYGARVDGRLVGVALCGHDGRRGYLHHVAVGKELRKRGIARALVERCLAALAAEGIDKCHLFVHDHNDLARSFWRHMGWEERDDVWLMSFISSGRANA
jgi:ribosomal protein S18 acetylase RimI-like enzyme